MSKLKYIAVIALLLALVPAALASASPRIEVSGTRSFTGPVIDVGDWQTIGDTCVGTMVAPIALAGTIDATCTLQLRVTEHDACPNEPFQHNENWRWYGECTGTVAGHSGDFTFDGAGVFRPGPPPYHRARVVLSGSGDMETMHGVLQFWGSPAEGPYYAGFVVFDGRP